MSNTIEIPELLKQREAQYGPFTEHSIISQNLQEVLRESWRWYDLQPIQKESLVMICHKIARILNGDPSYLDNWVDICGYSQLVINYLTETKKPY